MQRLFIGFQTVCVPARGLLLRGTAPLVLLAVLMTASPAHAICTPPSAASVVATCSGVTTDQDAPNGYGDAGFSATNATVDVLSGAFVTGTVDGISLGAGSSLNNAGTVTGLTDDGVTGPSFASIFNSGIITGATNGINVGGAGTVFNSGLISGGTDMGLTISNITRIENTGTISSANSNAMLTSIVTTFINSGTIVTTGVAQNAVSHNTITSFTNSGTIQGTRAGISGAVLTYLNNSGTISGTERGIFMSQLRTLVNSGTIIGGTDEAIRATSNVDTLLILLPGSNIQGLVDLGGGTNTLNVGNGLNTVTTFAALPTFNITNGAPFATQGTTVAVVDPTILSLADNVVSDLASSIFSTISNRLNEAGNAVLGLGAHDLDGTGLNVTPVAATPGRDRGFWLKGFGGVRKIDGSGPSVDAEHLFGGFVFGADGESIPGLKLGVFAGLSTGHVDTEFAAQNIDIDSYFAGFYGRHEGDGWWLDFAVTGGISEHDTQRLVANNQVPGGIERANADYDGYFISPEVTVGTKGDLLGHTVKPSLRARYVGAWFEDYTETGTAAPLSVDDREVHTLEGRLQLGVMLSEGPSHGFELRAGIDGRLFLGNDNVDATLFAQALSFDPGGHDESLSGFIGGHFYDQVTQSIQVFAGAEFGTGTEVYFRADAQAGVRISF